MPDTDSETHGEAMAPDRTGRTEFRVVPIAKRGGEFPLLAPLGAVFVALLDAGDELHTVWRLRACDERDATNALVCAPNRWSAFLWDRSTRHRDTLPPNLSCHGEWDYIGSSGVYSLLIRSE